MVGEVRAEVIRQVQLAGHAPDDRERAPSSVQVALVLAHLFLTEPRQVIAPGADDARDGSLGDVQRAVDVKRIVALVCLDLDRPFDAVESRIRCNGGFGSEAVGAKGRGRITYTPRASTGPERGNAPASAAGFGKDRVKGDF